MYDLLKAKNEAMRPELKDFCTELIQTPSVSLEEQRVAELVEQQMQELGYDRVVRDDTGNVIGVLFGRESGPNLLLNTHMDTVPPGSSDEWEASPYAGELRDGRIYGRGAADCKGGLAAQVFAGNLLKRSLLPLRGNLIVAATVAEENGRSLGVRGLLAKTLPELGLEPNMAILGEPTDLGMYYGHDGWLEADIEVVGTNPFHVDHAVRAIISDFEAESADQDLSQDARDTREEQTIHGPSFRQTDGVRRATVTVDRRLRDREDAEGVLQQIQHKAALIARSAGSVAVQTEVRTERQRLYTGRTTTVKHITHAWATDPFCPLVERSRQILAAAGHTMVPSKWRLGRLGMGTAGGVLLSEFGVPTIGYGPGNEEVAHGPNEYVDVEKLIECAYGTAALAHGLIGVPVFGWTTDDI